MNYTPELVNAQIGVEKAALRALVADRYPREEDPDVDAESEYADEQLALAARDLVREVEAMPPADRPIGWSTPAEAAR